MGAVSMEGSVLIRSLPCAVSRGIAQFTWRSGCAQELLPLLSTSLNTTSNTEEGSAGGTIEPALAQSASQMLMNDYGAKVVEGATAVFWAVGNTTITAWSSVLQFTVSLFLFLNLLYVTSASKASLASS